jgi:hypothetical protein
MSFPFIFDSNFEQGTNVEWDSETDVENALNIRHYSRLAGYDTTAIGPIAPYRGAYVAEWDLQADTADHILIEGDIDIADTVTRYSRFYLFLGKDLRATADDTFNLYEVQGTANAVENAVGLRITAATQKVEIGVGKVAPTVFSANPLVRGKWYCIELVSVIQTNGTGTGTIKVDGVQAAQVTTLTNTAVLRGALGVQDTLTTTLGHIFMDQYVFDDLAIGPYVDRYPESIMVLKSQHICVGDSELLNVTLLPGSGTDSVLKIYDTDVAYTSDETALVASLYNLTASEPPIDLADVPLAVKRGAYVFLSGTAPKALVRIGRSQGYQSVGRIRQHGRHRKPHPIAG